MCDIYLKQNKCARERALFQLMGIHDHPVEILSILRKNPDIADIFTHKPGLPVGENSANDTTTKQILVRAAEVLAMLSNGHLKIAESIFDIPELQPMSDDCRQKLRRWFLADPPVENLGVMAKFVLMMAVAMDPPQEMDPSCTMPCFIPSIRQMVRQGFEVLEACKVQLVPSFEPALEVYHFLPEYTKILTDTILSILSSDEHSEDEYSDYEMVTRFLAANPYETYQCIVRVLRDGVVLNTLAVLYELLEYEHLYPNNPLDDLDDWHVHCLDALANCRLPFLDRFQPCSPEHVERILCGCENKRGAWPCLKSTTLSYLLKGVVAPTKEISTEWCRRANALDIPAFSPSFIPTQDGHVEREESA